MTQRQAASGSRGDAAGLRSRARDGLAHLAERAKPPNPAVRGFVLATLVTSAGTGMYSTVSVVFFVQSLHLATGFVGVGLTVAVLCGLGAALPSGHLVDRFGAKPVLVGIYAFQAVLFALFPLVDGSAEFLIAVTLIAAAATSSPSASQALLSDLAGDGSRVTAAAYNRSVLNVGMSVGALFAAWALAVNSRAAYDIVLLVNSASFVGAAVLVGRLAVPGKAAPAASGSAPAAPSAAGRHPLRDPRFVAAAVSCGILYLNASVLDVALPLQVSQHTVEPRWMIAALIVLNTLIAVAMQVRASAGADTIPGATRANRLAGVVLLGSCALFAVAAHRQLAAATISLVAATVLLTAGELLSSAGTWGLSYGLAPADQQGKYLSSFSAVGQLVETAGPVIAVSVVRAGAAGWLLMGIVFAATGFAGPAVSRTGRAARDAASR